MSSGVRESGQELRKRQALYPFFSREGFPGILWIPKGDPTRYAFLDAFPVQFIPGPEWSGRSFEEQRRRVARPRRIQQLSQDP